MRKTILCLGISLLFTTQVKAEFYSWIDDNGTYNYTEDYSSVPKKYRKKVKRREDLSQDAKPQASPEAVTPSKQTDKKDVKSVANQGDDKDLYGGKSRAEWRKELDVREAELNNIEQRLGQLRSQISDAKVMNRDQLEALKKDYDDGRANYDQKYKSYTELIETVRKAGISVEIKK